MVDFLSVISGLRLQSRQHLSQKEKKKKQHANISQISNLHFFSTVCHRKNVSTFVSTDRTLLISLPVISTNSLWKPRVSSTAWANAASTSTISPLAPCEWYNASTVWSLSAASAIRPALNSSWKRLVVLVLTLNVIRTAFATTCVSRQRAKRFLILLIAFGNRLLHFGWLHHHSQNFI